MENTPANINNYATSAMVSVPLHELDVLRADLMKANAELTKMRDAQKQVIITHRKEVVANISEYDRHGDWVQRGEHKWLEESSMINMGEVTAKLQKEYDEKLSRKSNELAAEAHDEISSIKDEYNAKRNSVLEGVATLEKDLHKKYNGDKIKLLESELENCHAIVNDKTNTLVIAENKVVKMQDLIDLYKPGYSTLALIKQDYLEHKDYNVFERFIKGFYIRIDGILKDRVYE